MKSRAKILKAEKREKIQVKRKNAPKGGTLAGQLQKQQTSKNYKGKKKNNK